ncbi:MAG TPA: hypothetical protein VFG68_17665 [Fimbriiglobus sp.]|nr:hypothetical protein [Fimbriiglobus sp.]
MPPFGARGIRYDEPCATCRRVTDVCNACGRCRAHCSCERDAADRAEMAAFNREHPGFLDNLQRHRDQGTAEHD